MMNAFHQSMLINSCAGQPFVIIHGSHEHDTIAMNSVRLNQDTEKTFPSICVGHFHKISFLCRLYSLPVCIVTKQFLCNRKVFYCTHFAMRKNGVLVEVVRRRNVALKLVQAALIYRSYLRQPKTIGRVQFIKFSTV